MSKKSQATQIKPYRLVALLAAALAGGSALGQARSYEGKPVAMGKGSAHVLVRTDDNDKLTAISVVLTPGALNDLPKPARGARPDTAYFLPMPGKGPKTVIDHVMINWEPVGHPPPHVYDVPHFDFHFYLVSRAAQEKVRFKNGSESGQAQQQAPAELLPQGYVIPPGTAVPKMGAHAIDVSSSEHHGQPFTATFIYGYYNRQQTFLEPMVTLDYLLSKPSFSTPITRPSRYSRPGVYPGAYSVKHVASSDVYEVMLEDFK